MWSLERHHWCCDLMPGQGMLNRMVDKEVCKQILNLLVIIMKSQIFFWHCHFSAVWRMPKEQKKNCETCFLFMLIKLFMLNIQYQVHSFSSMFIYFPLNSNFVVLTKLHKQTCNLGWQLKTQTDFKILSFIPSKVTKYLL